HAMAEHAGRTALVDLDIHFGTAALQFDLEPGRGLVDALSNPDRIDALLLDRAALKVDENLAVFSAEAPLDSPFAAPDEAVLALLSALAPLYPHLVLDLPVDMLLGPAGREILAHLDDVLLVAEPTLAHVRDTIRIIAHLEQLGVRSREQGGENDGKAPRLRLLLNKLPAGGLMEVRVKDFAASVERPVDATLPLDPKAAVAAAQEARPVLAVAPRSPLARALRQAFGAILAREGKAADRGVLGRLFGR
ncbi:MAG: pilus assembly protein CpaE, partial [Alphaproteobacteria bacterium]